MNKMRVLVLNFEEIERKEGICHLIFIIDLRDWVNFEVTSSTT